jgi:hypothetical protein
MILPGHSWSLHMPSNMVGFALQPEIEEAVKRIAEQQDRSVSSYIRIALRRQLELDGALPGNRKARAESRAA